MKVFEAATIKCRRCKTILLKDNFSNFYCPCCNEKRLKFTVIKKDKDFYNLKGDI